MAVTEVIKAVAMHLQKNRVFWMVVKVEVEREVDSIYNLIYCLRTSILDRL